MIAELLVQQEGRLAVVGYKGSKKNSAKTALYNPFRLLQVQFKSGKGLHSLKSIDAIHTDIKLTGICLYCGFYLNELLCRLCQADAPYETLFSHYHLALKQLTSISSMSDKEIQTAAVELVLRKFEDTLLSILGYELNFNVTMDTGLAIEAELYYEVYEGGFVHTNFAQRGVLGKDIKGVEHLLRKESSEQELEASLKLHYLKQAKAILRASLHRHLGDKPLKSRELFRK